MIYKMDVLSFDIFQYTLLYSYYNCTDVAIMLYYRNSMDSATRVLKLMAGLFEAFIKRINISYHIQSTTSRLLYMLRYLTVMFQS